MNGFLRILVSVAAIFVLLKVVMVKPVKNYILGALLDGAYYMIKRKLKS